jgi:hypothetical protein
MNNHSLRLQPFWINIKLLLISAKVSISNDLNCEIVF